MAEASIESYAVGLAKKNGWFIRKVTWIGRIGAPDRLFAHPQVGVIFVEFKDHGKKPNPVQDREIERMRNAGLQVEVVSTFEACSELFG